MQRKTRKPPGSSKAPVKQRADDAETQERVLEASGPFVTFTEWASEADEKAYAKL